MSIEFDGPKCECGNNGCLEHYCSAIALEREVKKALVDFPKSPLQHDHSFSAIMKALKAGDELAVRELHRAAWYLGFGLASVVNLFNPDIITIGDDLARAGPLLLEAVQETVCSHVLPSVYRTLRIELSSFETDPVLVGVSTLVLEKVLQSPSALKGFSQNGALPVDTGSAGG
jgi:predicted NBD/HSP70 family sugar kinase